jgi:hypothetical protein
VISGSEFTIGGGSTFCDWRSTMTRTYPTKRKLGNIWIWVSACALLRPPFLPRVIHRGVKLDSVSKVERYRKEAIRCAELAKEASPPFLAEIYRKIAVRYVFMAEELLKGPARNEDAFERADLMISRLRSDATIESPLGYHARGSAPAGMRRSPSRIMHGAKAASGPVEDRKNEPKGPKCPAHSASRFSGRAITMIWNGQRCSKDRR